MRSIMLVVRYIFLGLTILFVSIASVNAAIINNSNTGLAAWSTLLEFDEVSIDQGAAVTNQYQAYGVTFEGLLFNPGWAPVGPDIWIPDGTRPILGNTTSSSGRSDPWSIIFDNDQHSVAFTLAMKTLSNSYYLTAYLADTVVESFEIVAGSTDSYGYYGFTGITFDRVMMAAVSPDTTIELNLDTTIGFTLIDNLQFATPVPAAVWLFGTALIGLFGFNKRRKAV